MRHLFKHFRREFVITIIVTCIVALVLRVTPAEFGSMTVKGFVAAFVIALTPLLMTVYRLRNILTEIALIRRVMDDHVGRVVCTYLFRRVLNIDAKQLTDEWYALHSSSEVEAFSGICFEHCRGNYVGTDASVPSEFDKRYPRYFLQQTKRKDSRRDVRFLLVSRSKLMADSEENQGIVAKFVQEHQAKLVRLLLVDGDRAAQFAALHELPSAEFGIFQSRFVVFFRRQPARPNLVQVRIAPLETRMFENLATFLNRIDEAADGAITWRNGSLHVEDRSDEDKCADRAKMLLRSNNE